MADNNEKIPEGWIKVKSKSRAGKHYYFNSELKKSVWNLEDIDKAKRDGKREPPRGTANKQTPEKSSNGTSNQSKVIRKNIASDRMKKLQKALKSELEQNGEIPAKKRSSPKKPTAPVSPVKSPAKKNFASQRLEKITKQLKEEAKVERAVVNQVTESAAEVEMMDCDELPCLTEENFEEPMEWEDVPVEAALLAVHQLRQDDVNQNTHDDAPVNDIKTHEHGSEIEFYVVVDTNVLISNLDYVKEIKGKQFKGELKLTAINLFYQINISNNVLDIGKATIFLPYMVLKELDKLKTRASASSEHDVGQSARRANDFISKCLAAKDEFLAGQSALDRQNYLIEIDSADDEIVNCLLQIKQKTNKVILLTHDKNLMSKAIVNKVESFSRDALRATNFNASNCIKLY